MHQNLSRIFWINKQKWFIFLFKIIKFAFFSVDLLKINVNLMHFYKKSQKSIKYYKKIDKIGENYEI